MSEEFLIDREDERPWREAGEERGVYWTGEGRNALEVVLTRHRSEPTRTAVKKLWRERWGNRAAPVLLVAAWPAERPERAWLCGPIGDDPALVQRDLGQAERLAARALMETSPGFAIQFLTAALAESDDPLPGIRNEGLLSSHELRVGVPARGDWAAASERAAAMLGKSDRELVTAMGYAIEQRGDHAILRTATGGEVRAVAVFLDRTEKPDAPSPRFDHRTPVDAALLHARREGLRWVLSVRGSSLRLYSSATSGAAGQRGRTETFLELDLALLESENAGYLGLLFAADALAEGGTFDEIAAASRDFVTALSGRLRDRVYDHVIPALATYFAASIDGSPSESELNRCLEASMTVLFRLLFVAYAEDQRLLPYGISEAYRENSLKALALSLSDAMRDGSPLGFANPFSDASAGRTDDTSADLWRYCENLFDAVDTGNPRWGVPAYNGGLFRRTGPVGALIAEATVPNCVFGPALAALLLDQIADGTVGPIDFRSLSVREFGSIYEGLLESSLSVAQMDLALRGSSGTAMYVPAGPEDEIAIRAGETFLNASGARKATGSYFTKSFAVEHLLEEALEPALNAHLGRIAELVDAGRDADAAESLFDFRVADLSMGSGHFLTAAIDRIEAAFSAFLAERSVPGVAREMNQLESSARERLGQNADAYEIEASQLLRRLIARRCIYGADVNGLAVELARVSIWIHTFVPGLPLSFLDRTLAWGDSLVGVGTLDELESSLSAQGPNVTFFDQSVREVLEGAREPLARLGRITDATPADIEESRELAVAVGEAVRPVTDLMDLALAVRADMAEVPLDVHERGLAQGLAESVRAVAHELRPIHFPARFPEVFLRENPGFDVIVGNPPWEELRFDTDRFWASHFPGHLSLPSARRTRERARHASERPDLASEAERRQQSLSRMGTMLNAGPDAGSDLAIMFSRRATRLIRQGGHLGYVLPNSATLGAARTWVAWRHSIRERGTLLAVSTCTNRNGWLFDDVHGSYCIILVSWRRGSDGSGAETRLRGRFYGLDAFLGAAEEGALRVRQSELPDWTPGKALIPAPPRHGSGDLLRRFLLHPRLGEPRPDFSVVAAHDGTAGVTTDLIERSSTDEASVQVIQGRHISHWVAPSEPAQIAESLLDPELREGLQRPRIGYRKLARPDDQHSFWVCPLPPRTFAKETSYALRFTDATPEAEVFALAVLSSQVFDWQARCWNDFHILPSLFAFLRVPVFRPESELHGMIVAAARSLLDRERFAIWGATGGGGAAPLEEVAALDAMVAVAFGLDEMELKTLFDTFRISTVDERRRDLALSSLASLPR